MTSATRCTRPSLSRLSLGSLGTGSSLCSCSTAHAGGGSTARASKCTGTLARYNLDGWNADGFEAKAGGGVPTMRGVSCVIEPTRSFNRIKQSGVRLQIKPCLVSRRPCASAALQKAVQSLIQERRTRVMLRTCQMWCGVHVVWHQHDSSMSGDTTPLPTLVFRMFRMTAAQENDHLLQLECSDLGCSFGPQMPLASVWKLGQGGRVEASTLVCGATCPVQ
eukprot:1158905-Pelagomonas_calceolata.AAC.7